MRTIKFRGKRKDNGEWVYGDLLQTNEGSVCIGVHGQYIDGGMHFNDMYNETQYIDEVSIGQFTGLTDCNGKEIYEGDLIKDSEFTYEVYYFEDIGAFMVEEYKSECDAPKIFLCSDVAKESKVIGNIHDNPELIPNQPTAI